MRCPKCQYITFDHIPNCPKCKTNLQNVAGAFQGTSVNAQPPSLLGSLTKRSSEPSVEDLLQGHDFGIDESVSSQNYSDEPAVSFDAADDLASLDDLDEVADLSSDVMVEDISLEDIDTVPDFDIGDDLTTQGNELRPPQLEKFSSDLSDIDISDLLPDHDSDDLEPVSNLNDFDASSILEPVLDDDDSLPTLEPLTDDTEELTTLEPLPNAIDASEIPEFADLESLSFAADEPEIPEITDLNDISIDSLEPFPDEAIDSLNLFQDDENVNDEFSSLLDDNNDIGLDSGLRQDSLDAMSLDESLSETAQPEEVIIEESFSLDELLPGQEEDNLEPIDQLLGTAPPSVEHQVTPETELSLDDDLSFDFSSEPQVSEDDLPSSVFDDLDKLDNSDEFDLSVDDANIYIDQSTNVASPDIELTLEDAEESSKPLKTKGASAATPEIPDIGLSMEFDQ